MTTKTLNAFKVDLDFKECITLIMNSVYFRKLADKTQVIISLSGPNVRNRLTHTIEVSKIARDLCKKLELNADLAEAIALAHDIGHTPFGHVGERTLKELMCKCDTLDNRLDVKLNNFGFKHNLQSALLINEIFKENKKNIELKKQINYLFWGVAAHSNLTWSKLEAGLDNEILVHCKHCNKVFDCRLSGKNLDILNSDSAECKFNKKSYVKDRPINNEVLNLENKKKNKICRPWVCARIFSKFKDQQDLHEQFIENTYCHEKCEFVDVWLYRTKSDPHFTYFKYLFDFPFSNFYYAPHFNNLINDEDNDDFISFEAVVVNAADEIAQRRQDFEDGISLKLIKVSDGAKKLKKLINQYSIKYPNQKLLNIKTKNRLDSIIHETQNTRNVSEFKEKSLSRELGDTIILFFRNIYLETILQNLRLIKDFKTNTVYDDFLNSYLNTKTSPIKIHELYSNYKWQNVTCKDDLDKINIIFFIADYLDKVIKSDSNKIISCDSMINLVNGYNNISFDEIRGPLDLNNIETIKRIQTFLDKGLVKNLYRNYLASVPGNDSHDIVFDDLDYLGLNKFIKLSKKNSKLKAKSDTQLFELYKKMFKSNANQGLMRFIIFDNEIDEYVSDFQTFYKELILQSEKVEKNDGKSVFIIKRLFKGYLSNPHQLPNQSLNRIWWIYRDFFYNKITLSTEFELIYNNLKKSFYAVLNDNNLPDISWDRSIIKKNHRLYPKEINKLNEAKEILKKHLKPTKLNDNISVYEIRRIIDNPILISSTGWKQALYRGITDHIASLTDREALSEYEKLYFTTVELG